MDKMIEVLEVGEEGTFFHEGYVITIEMGTSGYNGNIYKTLEDMKNENVLDGGICEGTAEDSIDFFKDTVDSIIANKNTFTFNIMDNNNSIIKTIEYSPNKTLEIFSSGHALYNYEGNEYYLFYTLEDAEQYIESDIEVPYAFQESIYENGEEEDNYEWFAKNAFVI